jgi:hypothetical protein
MREVNNNNLLMDMKQKEDEILLFTISSAGTDNGSDINPEEPIVEIHLEIVGLLSSALKLAMC